MQSLRNEIDELLKAHGLVTATHNEWVLVDGKLPAVAATIVNEREYDQSFSVQLDVEVALDAERVIIENFSGVGSTIHDAVANALENFCQNSFHVFLAAFWEQGEDDQVMIEQWDIAGDKWKVIIGNFGIRSFSGFPITVPPDLFPTIEKLIKELSLSDNFYWVRTFFCNINESKTVSEVMVNNNVWESAQNTISKLNWPKKDSYYSVRNFLILQREKVEV